MQLIWKNEQMYFRDIMNAFSDPKPHQNTVSTFLKILVDKNYLSTEKIGRIFLYKPSLDYETYKRMAVKKLLDNYFDNSSTLLVKLMLNEKIMSQKDIETILEYKSTKSKKSNPIKDFVKEITMTEKSPKKKKKEKKKNKKKKS